MSVCYFRWISIEHKFMFENPRTLHTDYSEKSDNVNVCRGNAWHNFKKMIKISLNSFNLVHSYGYHLPRLKLGIIDNLRCIDKLQ